MHITETKVIFDKIEINSAFCPYTGLDLLKDEIITCELIDNCQKKCGAILLLEAGIEAENEETNKEV